VKEAKIGGGPAGSTSGKEENPPGQFHEEKETTVNDTLIPPNIIPVNDNPPTLSEAALTGLSKAVANSFVSVNNALTWVHAAITSLEEAKGIVDTTGLQDTTDLGAALDASVNVLVGALDALCEAQGVLESNCAADEAVSTAGSIEDDDDEVAGYLAVGPSASDSVIDGFIAAVGPDRVLNALDRLTAPAEADLAN
jgi:hypothetical protein